MLMKGPLCGLRTSDPQHGSKYRACTRKAIERGALMRELMRELKR